MLANDGKDGAPFLDVHQLGQARFFDFGPDNPISIVHRVNESWHRDTSEPAMVRMSTKQYPIGSHASPLEEIDEVADKVFNDVAFTSRLSTGCATKPMNRKKGRGRGILGAALREAPRAVSRGNWLTFPLSEAARHPPTPPQASLANKSNTTDADIFGNVEELRILQDMHNATYSGGTFVETSQCPTSDLNDFKAGPTQQENLLNQYEADVVDSNRPHAPESSEDDLVRKVPSWHTRLIDDHKRRLAERWAQPPHILQRVLPGIKQVIVEAFTRGYRPIGDDYQDKINIIEDREQRRCALSSPEQSGRSSWNVQERVRVISPSSDIYRLQSTANQTTVTKEQHVNVSRKRHNTCSSTSSVKKAKVSSIDCPVIKPAKRKVGEHSLQHTITSEPQSHHLSGSTTLEFHQVLPPDAYFEPQQSDEKPAWRCGIKHAMGYYYNAGNRTACPGCFTNIKESVKTKHMDFYLPPSKYFFQPASDMTWTPRKPLGKARRTKHLSHNSRAKEAYWTAIEIGATADEARQAGVEAVEAALRPRSPKEPSPEPTPEPEPDLGPHPSGSTAMEHGQDIPECAYFEKHDEHEEYAWRCDVNHALGRYYLAGDKRSCPGCGSNRHGAGKQADMDFYMPNGVVIRQEAPNLCQWTPRKPYKPRKATTSKNSKVKYLTHNQNCSKKYFEAVEAGHEHEKAVKMAINGLEADLEVKQFEAHNEEVEETVTGSTSTNPQRDSANPGENGSAQNERCRHNSPRSCTSSSVPKKRKLDEASGEAMDDIEEHEMLQDLENAHMEQQIIEVYSSSDEESSGSDSE
jgi:hypothetical protein